MSSYYPNVDQLKRQLTHSKIKSKQLIKDRQTCLPTDTPTIDGLITPGYLVTDGFTKDLDDKMSTLFEMYQKATDLAKKRNLWGLINRLASVSDLTPTLYAYFNHNRNTMSYWFPMLERALKQIESRFKIPKTKIITLPPELSQYMRVDYADTTPASRDFFNHWLFDKFELEPNGEYFIKTGNFSSKFEFRNAHLLEPLEIGDYFSVINNFAMQVGAGLTNDVVVREWIADPEQHDTIYSGMPLRTEFRAFIDCDRKQLIDIVPYWNPIVMKNVLSQQGQFCADIQKDYQTYLKNQDRLTNEFNQWHNQIRKDLQPVIDKLQLDGCWSLDIMKSGTDFYIIDMADMRDSALTDLIAPNKLQQYRKYLQRIE